MVDWEILNLVEDDPFISDEARTDRNQLRRELQSTVPTYAVVGLLAWHLLRGLLRLAWSAGASRVSGWRRQAPVTTAPIVAAGTTPPERESRSLLT
ncbi:MAG: hypothetical protein ACRD26_09045 [Vicinamibacterales bacterium]